MAINNENDKNKGTVPNPAIADAFKQADIRAEEQAAGEAPSRRRRSENRGDVTAASINTHFRRSMSRAPTSQAVIEFEKAFTKTLAESENNDADYPVQIAIRSIDSGASQDVAIATILVCAHFEAQGKKQLVVFMMLVEGSIGNMAFTEIAVPGRNKPVQLQLTAGDYAVESLWSAIVNKLEGIYGSDYNIQPVGNFTLPRTIDPVKDQAVIRSSLFAATSAIDTYIENNFAIGSEPLTIQVVTNKATNSIILDLNSAPATSATGLPIRDDLALTLRSTVRSTALGVPDKLVPVVTLRGYVNLAFTMPPAPSSMQQRPDTRRFTPMLILTDVESDSNLVTLETQLLGLAMTPVIDYNDQWLAPFMPNATARQPGRDLGAVGFEVNLSGDENGKPLGKEDLSVMSTAEIYQLTRMAIFTDDSLHVYMLIGESDPLTWMNSVFLDAAVGGNGAAYDAIVRAADNLTGQVFSKVFTGGPIAHLTNTRMHQGYFTDDNGDVRDLNDIDYLWVLNRCGKANIELAYQFADTFLGTDDPTAQLADRWEIITKLVPSATLVGYAQLVEIDPTFLISLTQSTVQAGLAMRASNSLVDFNNARGRASYQGGVGLNSRLVNDTLAQSVPGRTGRSGPTSFGIGMNRQNYRNTR